ncbi:hypothetical protein [Sedimentitalea todarodis]|uniref:ABC transmembrane type-1 domain-containing protein n=1 Tax=Sedimentitalea todarodis TaxID=1631240 RepID=A0ABU3V9K1_9RHOB|nr:hypothetical protein [Sedimentitalea todarodis]MDU9002838.1 hypothetical protein [Sedimentitalea todarodis]
MQKARKLTTIDHVHRFRSWPFSASSVRLDLPDIDPGLQQAVTNRINTRLGDCGCGISGLCVLISLITVAPPMVWAGVAGRIGVLPIAITLLGIAVFAAFIGKMLAALRLWRSIRRDLDRLTKPSSPQPSMRMTSLVGS